MSDPEKDFLPPWKQHVADQEMYRALYAQSKEGGEAFYQFWKENWPGLCPTQVALVCWREATRRARDSEEEWELTCESLTEENNHLRELLKDAVTCIDPGSYPLTLEAISAALEGKE